MDPDFRDIFAGLAQASQGLQGIVLGLQQVMGGARHAQAEHGDLRESVARLEQLITDQGGELRGQGEQLRALLEEIRQLRDGNGGGA
jgi:hypothetical protein